MHTLLHIQCTYNAHTTAQACCAFGFGNLDACKLLDLLSMRCDHQQPTIVLEAWKISCDMQVGKRLMLLYIQPQCADLDLTTPACLDNFAVRSVPAKISFQCM